MTLADKGQRTRESGLFLVATAALGLLACGAEVAIDGAGPDDAVVATDAGADTRRERCTRYCDLSGGGFCSQNPSCVDACLNELEAAGDCSDDLAAVLDCIIDGLAPADGGCALPPPCEGPSADYQECKGP